ncbi:MAG: hypothetical protein K2X74_15405 [Acetobacteraceae bacterium]|nr:hypothetical protein [Acetobacteraceae bacterium]
MFATEDEIYSAWLEIGGEYLRFDQYDFLPEDKDKRRVNLGTGRFGRQRTKQIDGICRALALRFIECRLTGMTSLEEFHDTLVSASEILMRQQGAYELGLKHRDVAGGVKGKTTGSWGRAVGNREELMTTLFNERQLFIYSFHGSGGGHAVAFDSTQGIWFMDANFGLFHGPNVNPGNFAWWFNGFWECPSGPGGASYKSEYHRGDRYLTRFGPAGSRWQLNAIFGQPTLWRMSPIYVPPGG